MFNILLLKEKISIEILIEEFEDSVLVTSYNHIKECYYLDYKIFNHFSKTKVFSYSFDLGKLLGSVLNVLKLFYFIAKITFSQYF